MPPGTPFLERLAATLLADTTLDGRFGASELADITILLPTRRAVRALGEAFCAPAGGTALILPSITLGLYQMTLIMRLVRSEMLEVLRQDYIRSNGNCILPA